MKRFHVHVSVKDLSESVRFYSKLFGVPPAVEKPDYAKWMLEDPRINFAISQRGRSAGVNHLGFQVDSEDELKALRRQVAAADLSALDQREAACCYARSDKYWVEDPRGSPGRPSTRSAGFRSSVKKPSRQATSAPAASRSPSRDPRRKTPAACPRAAKRLARPAAAESPVSASAGRTMNVLFLCTGNSARSILAEAITNSLAVSKGKFRAYSAGSHPKGKVNPYAFELLRETRLPTAGLRSKSWDEFAQPGAPVMDFVITVCDQAAGEQCPYWPGQPVTAHWGMPDPAAVEGTEEVKRRAFSDTANMLRRRIELLASLPLEKLDRLSLQNEVRDIGKAPP